MGSNKLICTELRDRESPQRQPCPFCLFPSFLPRLSTQVCPFSERRTAPIPKSLRSEAPELPARLGWELQVLLWNSGKWGEGRPTGWCVCVLGGSLRRPKGVSGRPNPWGGGRIGSGPGNPHLPALLPFQPQRWALGMGGVFIHFHLLGADQACPDHALNLRHTQTVPPCLGWHCLGRGVGIPRSLAELA